MFTNSLFACFNWVWHGFIDHSDPSNKFTINTNIIDGTNNMWGEDFHYYHHRNPLDEWQSAHDHFDQIKEEKDITTFKNCNVVDIFLYSVCGLYGLLADIMVDNTRTREEKMAVLEDRLSFIPTMPDKWEEYYYYF